MFVTKAFVCFKIYANNPPINPNKIPSTNSLIDNSASIIYRAPISKVLLCKPNNPETYAAVKLAGIAQDIARYFKVPATNTSNAKNIAVIGVPNSPAKPAAIPATINITELFLKRKYFPK